MTLTLDLTPELESLLCTEAARHGLPLKEFALRALDIGARSGAMRVEPDAVPQTGAEALAYWEQEGVLGIFGDRPDSPEFARELRRQAERRER
jgi:hypothetical protein